MIARTLSTIVLWAIVFAAVGFGGAAGGVILLAVFSTLAQSEFQALLAKAGLPPWRLAPLALGFAIVLTPACTQNFAVLISLVSLAALAAGTLSCAKDAANLRKLAGSILAIAYVPALMQFYALILREYGWMADRGEGVGLVIWVIATAKFTDVGGYLVGRLVGRHKLAPSISPGKTWEGAAGGLAFAAAVGALLAQWGGDWLPYWLTPGNAARLALPVGAAAIVSDLSESVFKRIAGLKDSGRCIPGIGGALDLADSLLFTGPVAYCLFYLNLIWR